MAVVGSAEVIVRAITNKVKGDIDKAFKDLTPAIRQQGERLAKEFSDSFGKSINQNLGDHVDNAVHNATTQAGATLRNEMGTAGREAGSEAGRELDDALGSAGGSGGRRSGKNFFGEFGKTFRRELSGAANRLLFITGLFDILGPLIAVAVGGISALTSGFFAMGAAAAQAVGAVAVLPGLIAAAAQAFGAIKLAFGGIGEAIGLGTKAQDAAATGATSAAKAAASTAASQKALAAAQDDLTDAQERARKAQEALNKARDRAKDAGKGIEDAEARLAAAVQERNRVLSDPNASQADGAAAQAAVDAAQGAYDSLVKDKKKAQTKLRKADEENDAAQQNLTKAQKARDKASKAAAAGGIPESPAVKAANAYADALAALTPEARAFVIAVVDMRKRFKEVGEAIGKELFPPLTKALGLLGDSRFFKIFQDNMSETGGILGEFGLNLTKAFTTPRNMERFQNILKGNNNILELLNKTTEDGTSPAQSFVNIILKLLRAIQPLTKRFATFLSETITGFDKANSVMDFKKFFKRAGDSAAQLGRIFGNLFSVIGNLGGGAKKSGQGLLDSFEKATKKLDKFTEKLNKDGTLDKFFTGVADNMRAIGDLVTVIGDEFLRMGDNEGIATFAESLEPGVKALGDIFTKLTEGDSGAALGDLFSSISETLNELTQSGQLKVFLDTITIIVKGVGLIAKGFNAIPGSGGILAVLAVFRGVGFVARIAGFAGSFDKLRTSLFKLAKMPFQTLARKLGLVNSAGAGTHRAGVPQTAGVPGAPTAAEAATQGNGIGAALARGMALGIRENTGLVISAIDDLGDAAVLALKTKLGIASPSVVFTKLGDNTADGFVLGLRAGTDDAFRAGEGLGAAAAAGARSSSGAAIGAGAVVSKAAAPIVPAGSAAGVSKLAGTTGKLAKTAGPLSKLSKGFSALSTGLLGVSGPILLVIGGIVLLVIGLKKLYQHSPQFRKFVDNIVDKLKQLGDWFVGILKKFVLPALDKFFGWVNANLPKVQKIFGVVFGAIGKAVSAIAPVIAKVLKFVIDHWRLFLPLIIGPLGIAVGLITKYWDQISAVIGFAIKVIKLYITKILIPYWKLVFRVFKALVGVVRIVFDAVKDKITSTFNNIKAIWENVLKPVFNGIKDTVQDRINAVRKTIQVFKDAFETVSRKISNIGEGIKTVFNGIRDAIVGAFEGLIDKIKGPLGAVIDFLNDNLIDPLNSVTSKFGLTVPNIPGFAEGGYTGPGSKNKVAGLVHADEQVIKASSRRKIERSYPGLLDRMNKTGGLGFSDGFGGFGPIGDIAGGVADLAGDVAGGVKNIGEKIAKEGLGKVLQELVNGVKSGMGAAGINRSGFINEFIYGILDKLGGAVDNWGGAAGKGALSSGKWVSPLAGSFPITQYANSGHSPPWAIDIGAPDGSVVQAASAGRIVSAIDKGTTSYGKYLVLAHAKGVTTLYAHLSSWVKSAGATVAAGQQIAWSGHSGGVRSSIPGSTGAHLHFEIRPGSDTLEELRKRGVKLARGGVAKATTGGILSVIAEAGKNERVEPLDNNGMSKRDREIMKLFAANGKGGDMTVNVNNPAPERASVSVAKGIRSKAISSGWGV